MEQFQQSQTQCLYREFLSLAQTHRPTAKKDKVNHRLCFLLASRPAEGPYLTPPLALLQGAESVDSLRRRSWKMRRPSRRIFTEVPHQKQVTTHVLIENAKEIDSVRWVSCQTVTQRVSKQRRRKETKVSCRVCLRLTLALFNEMWLDRHGFLLSYFHCCFCSFSVHVQLPVMRLMIVSVSSRPSESLQ